MTPSGFCKKIVALREHNPFDLSGPVQDQKVRRSCPVILLNRQHVHALTFQTACDPRRERAHPCRVQSSGRGVRLSALKRDAALPKALQKLCARELVLRLGLHLIHALSAALNVGINFLPVVVVEGQRRMYLCQGQVRVLFVDLLRREPVLDVVNGDLVDLRP